MSDHKPQYTHDCKACSYLGAFNYEASGLGQTRAELYVCPCDNGTLIARLSSEPSNYASSTIGIIQARRERYTKDKTPLSEWSTTTPALFEALKRFKVECGGEIS